MTAPALVKQSDLKRMAAIANEQNVTVEIVEGSRVIRVSPAAPVVVEKVPLAPKGGVRF